jgi:Haloacid dehalogenase-like hydrolase/ABC transporter substrate binding protein
MLLMALRRAANTSLRGLLQLTAGRTVVTSVEHGRSKPHRAIFEHAIRALGLAPSESLSVGDSYVIDYLGAKAVGMPALLIDPRREGPVPANDRISHVFETEYWLANAFSYPELLREMLPWLRRVLVLYGSRDTSPRQSVAVAQEAAARLRITLVERAVRIRVEVTQGLAALDEVDGLLGIPGGVTSGFYEEMIRAAHAKRRPTMFYARTRTTIEALASYGTSDAGIGRHASWLPAPESDR